MAQIDDDMTEAFAARAVELGYDPGDVRHSGGVWWIRAEVSRQLLDQALERVDVLEAVVGRAITALDGAPSAPLARQVADSLRDAIPGGDEHE